MSDKKRRPWEALPAEALATWAPQLPVLVDEIIAAIRAEVPAYARPLEGAFGQAVRLGVEEALKQFSVRDRGRDAGRRPGRGVYVDLGRGEAREGRTLEALLAAYRVGAIVAWRRLAAAGVAAGLDTDTLVLLAESIFAYIDELSAESADGFAQEQAARAGEADRLRSDLIELLLRTPPASADTLARAAQAADWPLPRSLAVLVWPEEAGRRLVFRLPVGCIGASIEGQWCAVVPDPGAPGRRAEIDRAMVGTATGLGSAVAPEAGARSHAHARAALRLAQERGGTELIAASEHRIALLLREDPGLVAELAAERLAPLDAETELSRERLAETLLAWLRHQGNAAAASEQLGVHAQTVRYRLGRLRELFGDALDDPDARYELETALRATSG
ncbi:MAG: PucR family transcriptional regulator [Solirubrobacteraceae bacterium]